MVANPFQPSPSDHSVLIIAEAGLNHNGSVTIAKQMIDVAARCGVDAVKFQKRTVATLAIREVLDAEDRRFPEFGSTYRQIREHLELDWDAYVTLKAYTESNGLTFICTGFDPEAIDFLDRLGVPIFKLASHSLTNLDLLHHVADKGRPVILSTGMAEWDELDRAVAILNQGPLALLHCVSAYPTPVEQCNLSMISLLKERYRLTVGYSGHEMGYLPSVAAVAMGAKIIERHFTLDCRMTGFDHKISLEPDALAAMVRDIRQVEAMHGHGEKRVSDQERITRNKYHVSMASVRPLRAGERLTREMIAWTNPGTGIPAKEADRWLGKTLAMDVPGDVLIQPEMFAS
ncbi:MAG: N-acetylneuraminate synthase family protein [Magnetococcales bacterium]|nr:N-acetylneuraminate synthase family protein [Magnetococcales bacterium]